MAAQGMHPNLHVGPIKRKFQQHSAKVEVSAKKMPDLHSNWRKGQRGYVKLVIPYRNIFKVNKKRRHLSLSDVFGSGNGKDCNLSVFRANLWEQSCLDIHSLFTFTMIQCSTYRTEPGNILLHDLHWPCMHAQISSKFYKVHPNISDSEQFCLDIHSKFTFTEPMMKAVNYYSHVCLPHMQRI